MTALASNPTAKTPAEAARANYPRVGLLINGEWIYDRPKLQDIINPSDESVLGVVPCATNEDIDRALRAAEDGFRVWRKVPLLERSALLHRTAALLRERIELVAATITLEQGKPLPDARAEVLRSASFLDWDAEQMLRRYGRIVPSDDNVHTSIVREPVGPVAAFTPWNVPLSAPSRKLSASLAAGCSVILKPAEETPATACLYAQCFMDAGVPPGVINIVFGPPAEVSTRLILSPVTRMVTLTGSVPVGKALARLAAEGLKPSLMELGGHAPVLIDEGVDVQAVARLAVSAKYRMAGQICASPTRFIVHRKAYGDFVSAFASEANALKVGDGFEPGVQMGPVVSDRRVAAMTALVEDAVSRGAKVAAGGQRIRNRGYFFAPTVLADVPRDADAMTIEPFGPLALCLPVDTLEEGVAVANRSDVGLAGYFFTNDIDRIDWMTREIEVGVLAANTFAISGPEAEFGGVKESGVGREGGEFGLDAYTVSKTIMRATRRP